jgi:hypothetical protein
LDANIENFGYSEFGVEHVKTDGSGERHRQREK